MTIAHRKAIDITRSRARRAVPVELLPESSTPSAAAESPDLDLVAAMALLPSKQKQVVAYHYLAGLPYREIAIILGGSTDAARRAAADGIAALRRSYPELPHLVSDPDPPTNDTDLSTPLETARPHTTGVRTTGAAVSDETGGTR